MGKQLLYLISQGFKVRRCLVIEVGIAGLQFGWDIAGIEVEIILTNGHNKRPSVSRSQLNGSLPLRTIGVI